MKRQVLAWAAVCSGVSALQVVRDAAEPVTDVRPVTRVVQLLRDMKTQLEKEADADEETYENLACFCKSNDREKTKAIQDGQDRVTQLSTDIETNIRLGEKMRVQIGALQKELAKGRSALERAIALRTKQKEEFQAEEKEMLESISALDAAVTVLARHQTGAALVSAKQLVSQVGETLERLHAKRALLQRADGPAFKASYEPQSGEVFGILKQMKETFEADLSASRKEELDAQGTFADLKQAKETQLKVGAANLQDKQEQLAHADGAAVAAKQDREDTEAALAADKSFLSDLKVKCALSDHEWEQRQKMRQDELSAVSEAIGLLSTDDARELFGRVLEAPAPAPVPALLELGISRSHGRSALVEMMQNLAATHQDARLAKLAVAAQLDAFTQVKKAIDDLIGELHQEGEDDAMQRDRCISDIDENERLLAKEDHAKVLLTSKLDGLHASQKAVQQAIEDLRAEITELEAQLKTAKDNREEERSQFDTTLADQKAAQQLLEQALHVLELRYKAKPAAAALVAVGKQVRGVQPPPKDFQEYEKSGHAPSILALLQHIIEDSVNLQEEARKSESEARDAYTQFVQATSVSVHAKKDSIVNRQAELAQVDDAAAQTDAELDESVTELESLTKGRGDLKGSCDFMLKNFDTRVDARAQEVESLRQAKAYLSGMK